MTAASDEGAGRPASEADRELVERLTLLGKALGNPVRIRIAAAFLRAVQASPRDLTAVIGEELGNTSYHVRYLHKLGFLRLEQTLPRRGSIAHVYSMTGSLRRALPAAATALGEEAAGSDALSDDDVLSTSYSLVDFQASEIIALHGDALTRAGQALSDDVRTQILGYLLQHEHATEMKIAIGMDMGRSAVLRHLRILAEARMVRATDENDHWTITPPTRKALAGFKDLLLAPESAA